MKAIALFAFFLIVFSAFSQNISIHQTESEYYAAFGDKPASFWDSLSGYKPVEWATEKNCNLNRIVFGWHPYWVGSVYTNYQWNLLSHFCFFSYDVNSSTGNATSTHNFATDPSIDAALSNNVKVQLCVVLFSDHATFFGSPTAPQTLINNLISLVQSRGIHGVNIDFEGVPSTQRTNLTNFMISLCNQMHTSVPGSEVSICLPAVDWSNTFDVAAMNSYVDQFCIMGYDYYYGGSGTAGPTSPTYSFETNSILNISRSVTYYLNKNVSHSKLVLGLPYFSFDYATSSSAVPSSTTAAGSSRTFKTIHANTSGYYSSANKSWSANSFVPYYVYNNGEWHQCHIDDDYSFGKKLDVVLKRGIAGIAIWALGYDDGYPYYWNKINEKLTDCYYTPCQDTIFDMGGPNGKYFDNENYTYTLAPQNATGLTLAFTQFNVEANFDTLWLYDGPATTSPLIGAYTGTNSPGTVNSSGGYLTLRFKSDGATTNPGFYATLQCAIDDVPPTTLIDAGNWQTQDFTATFTDNDNIQVGKRFFQVMDNDGSEWRASGSHGFFNDNFGSVIHPEWVSVTGDWSVTGGHLVQTNEAVANTNIYAPVQQSAPYEYLYHWQMYIDGAQANKRAGFHFFCDNPTLDNRNNSYFIWFRLGTTPYIELYKVTANVFSMVHYVSYPLTAATWYDVKVMFSPVSGKMEVYINNEYLTSWTDASPWQSGIAISPRTGNSATQYDDIKVYRSRTASEQVSVGSASAMVRYQNNSPSFPSCRIRSLVADVNHNLATTSTDVSIDWTAPLDVQVFDGPMADIDTSFSLVEMEGNWTSSSDPHSGLVQYHYALGTQPFTDDISGWMATTDLFAQISGLSLTDGETYYMTVRAENGAGLMSSDSASNGQVAWFPVTAEMLKMNRQLRVFPNPAHTVIYIVCQEAVQHIRIVDMNGKTLRQEKGNSCRNLQLNIENLPEGCYKVLVNEKYSANIVKN